MIPVFHMSDYIFKHIDRDRVILCFRVSYILVFSLQHREGASFHMHCQLKNETVGLFSLLNVLFFSLKSCYSSKVY